MLCGVLVLNKTLVSLKTMINIVQREGQRYLVEFENLQKQLEDEKGMENMLLSILDQF